MHKEISMIHDVFLASVSVPDGGSHDIAIGNTAQAALSALIEGHGPADFVCGLREAQCAATRTMLTGDELTAIGVLATLLQERGLTALDEGGCADGSWYTLEAEGLHLSVTVGRMPVHPVSE
jgi:hypothetical protein